MSFSPKACLSRGSRPQSCPKTPLALVLLLVACLFFHLAGPCEASRATLLVPSKPSIESPLSVTQATEAGEAVAKPNEQEKSKKSADEAQKSKQGEKNGAKSNESAGKADAKPDTAEVCEIVDAVNASIQASIAPQQLKEEVDLLIVGMEAFRYRGVAIDPPRIFTIYRFDKDAENPRRPARREDRLGDIEEIRYLNQKAWGANVGLDRPGLYQFVIETQPWWSQSACLWRGLGLGSSSGPEPRDSPPCPPLRTLLACPFCRQGAGERQAGSWRAGAGFPHQYGKDKGSHALARGNAPSHPAGRHICSCAEQGWLVVLHGNKGGSSS